MRPCLAKLDFGFLCTHTWADPALDQGGHVPTLKYFFKKLLGINYKK
jgi:hypothetical protein